MSNKDKDLDLPLDEAATHEKPKYEGDVSPDYFSEPKKGDGVRRLNMVPLYVIAVLVLLAVAGITYTFISRQEAAVVQKKDAPPPRVNESAKPPVRPTGADYVTAEANNAGEIPADIPKEKGVTVGPAAPPGQTPMDEAMQRRLRMIQQAEEKQLAKLESALDGDATVSNFGKRGGLTQTAANAADLSAARPNPQELMQRYMAASGISSGDVGGGMGGMGGAPSMASENGQLQKKAFLTATPEANVYLDHQRKAAIAPSQEVKAGTVIPGVMVSGINSDLPGQIIGRVSEAVYDSATGTQMLIPPGATLIGTYDSGVTLGQNRALVAWKRIIYPDSSSISLDAMPGADQGGYAGFNDKVNNHYVRIFGQGLLLSLFSAGIQLSQPQAQNGENYSSSQIIAGSLGQQMGQLGMQMAQRNMNIQPTLQIRPGYEFNVMVTKDILLPTWEGHPMANNRSQ